MILQNHNLRKFHLRPSVCSSDGSMLTIDFHRPFSKVTDNHATELYFEEIFEHGFSGADPLFDLRNYFFPESDDPNIFKLSNAGCVLEVLECFANLKDYNHMHITQSVATLHHLQKLTGYLNLNAEQNEHYRNVRKMFNR